MVCFNDFVKYWKYDLGDFDIWLKWVEYIEVYNELLSCCNFDVVFWYIILLDYKWYCNWVMGWILLEIMWLMKFIWLFVNFDVEVEKRCFE